MSSTPPATPELNPPPGEPAPALGPIAPVETAPSATIAEGPTLIRVVGFIGLFLAVLGLVVVVTTRAIGPRWVGEGWGFAFGGAGLVLMLCHALVDGEQEVRRMYGIFAAVLLVLALLSAVVPGPYDSSGLAKSTGYYLMPWGLTAAMLSLLFALAFVRHEPDDGLRGIVLNILLALGALLCVGTVLAAVLRSDFPVGTEAALALLGVGFICAYLSRVDASEGPGYAVAFTLGALGAAVLFLAFAWATFPTVLHEGPGVLRKPNQSLDWWKAGGRALVVLAFLGVAALGALGKFPMWLKGTLVLVGLVVAGVFVVGSFSAPMAAAPAAFLVPRGLVLGGIGLVYLAVSLGVCSDSQFVTLTRRELSAYFFSPIGYLVLGGMVACQWFGYVLFYWRLSVYGRQQIAIPEPIVGEYLLALIPVLCVIFPVPALTMRLFSEEKRTGSLEVLFTAPVNEWPVVLSKFLATWMFFLLCWLPSGLFLIGIQAEAGAPFDYRPLLSFYAALAACSAAFIACGLFFSSLTSNQIVAAVLTLMVLLLLVVCYFVKSQVVGLGPLAQAFLTRLSFIDLWQQSLNGQLPIRDVLVWASAAVFGLFLCAKVLEARKWT
jgi:ABC-type transport system involved in multi-copper enzyme maturation permease subunit